MGPEITVVNKKNGLLRVTFFLIVGVNERKFKKICNFCKVRTFSDG
jgi:hypothetical protein